MSLPLFAIRASWSDLGLLHLWSKPRPLLGLPSVPHRPQHGHGYTGPNSHHAGFCASPCSGHGSAAQHPGFSGLCSQKGLKPRGRGEETGREGPGAAFPPSQEQQAGSRLCPQLSHLSPTVSPCRDPQQGDRGTGKVRRAPGQGCLMLLTYREPRVPAWCLCQRGSFELPA